MAKFAVCKTHNPLALALRLGTAVMFRTALMIPLKADHPRLIDHLIDYFGERHLSMAVPPPTPANLASHRVA